MAQPKRIYDPESDEESLSAVERAQKSWGMSTDLDDKDLEEADDSNPNKTKTAKEKAKESWGVDPDTGKSVNERENDVSQDDGNKSEVSAKEGGLQNSKKVQGKAKNLSSSAKKKIALALGSAFALFVVGIAAFLPKIMSEVIINKLTETFLGRPIAAVQERAEQYAGKYVTKVIGGELRGSCGATVNRECVAAGSLMGRLTEQWKTNRIEDKLFRKYGLEFELDEFDQNKIRVKQYGTDLGEFGERSVTKKVIDTIDTETKFEGILTRRHVRSVLARKYGADKFCIIACESRDKLDDAKISALRKLKLKIIARVSDIGLTRTSAYLLCLTTSCNETDLKNSENQAIQEIAQRIESDYLQELADDINGPGGSRNLSELVIKRMVSNLLIKVGVSQGSAKAVASTIPIAGQIYLAATAIEMFTNADEKIKNREISKYLYDVNTQGAALYATQVINLNDDNNSGQAALRDSWASFELLNGFAESRVWQEANGIEAKSTVKCEETGVILSGPNDPLTCPETHVQYAPFISTVEDFRNDPAINFIFSFANTYNACIATIPGTNTCIHPRPRTVIKPALDIVNATLGFIGESAFTAAKFLVPGLGDFVTAVQNFVGDYATRFFTWATSILLPQFINPDAEDRLAFEQAAAGYDVMGKEFCRGDEEVDDASSIGCKVLSAPEQAQLDTYIAEKKREELQYESAFSRYLDVSNSSSLASNTTVAAATGFKNKGVAGFLNFNVASIINTFTNIIGGQNKAYAISASDRAELFGITQYGYAVDDPNLSIDPELLTPEVCEQFERERLESRYENEVTGETDYSKTNPCAIDEVIIDSYAKSYNLDEETSLIPGVTPIGSEGPITINGDLAFPLAVTKSQVGGGIFRNGDTDQASHPYIAYDLIASKGTTSVAMTNGVIVRVSSMCGGNTAGITLNVPEQGISIWYGHQDPATVLVREGQTVTAGTPLAKLVDHTVDCASGADHLHIDASINEGSDIYRPGCSRTSCENQYRFRSIGPQLYDLYQELPE